MLTSRTRTTSTPWPAPPGLHTHGCICCTLLQHADLMEAHRQKYNGSHLIVPCSAQYKTLFPEITMLCNHWGLLINHSSRKPYPMVFIGDFSLVDKIFPGSPMDSLLFNGEELARLKIKGYQVSTFQEEKPHPNSPKRKNSCPPAPLEMCWVPPAGRGSLPRPAASHPGLPHPGLLSIPLAARNHHPAAARDLGQRNSVTKSHTAGLSNIRTNHVGTRAVSTALTRKAPSPHASATCLHHHDLLPLRGWGKSVTWKILSRP